MSAKRVLVVSSTYPRWAGDTVPSFVHQLNKRLASDYEVDVLVPHAKGAATEEILDGVRVYRFRYAPQAFELLAYGGGMTENIRRNKWLFLLVPAYAASLFCSMLLLQIRRRYDLLHAHWLIPQGALAAAAIHFFGRRLPLVLTSHGADLFGFRGRIGRAIKKLAIRNGSLLTVVSEAMRKEAEELGANTIHVVSMGVDVQLFSPASSLRTDRDVLFVGRFVQKKGISVLLEAISKLKERGVVCSLDLIGGGPAEAELKELAKKLGIIELVHFLGAKSHDDLPRYYRSSKIVVVPSVVADGGDQEGLGLVAVEAMACQCAVIASELPALCTVIDGKTNGLLFPPGDAEALARCIETLLANELMRERLGRSARQHVIERFSWQVISERYREIFDRLVFG